MTRPSLRPTRQDILDALWTGIVTAGLVFMGALALISLPRLL